MAVIIAIALCFALTSGDAASTVQADSTPAFPNSAGTSQNMVQAEPVCPSDQTSLLQTKAKVKPGNERATEETFRTTRMKKGEAPWTGLSWCAAQTPLSPTQVSLAAVDSDLGVEDSDEDSDEEVSDEDLSLVETGPPRDNGPQGRLLPPGPQGMSTFTGPQPIHTVPQRGPQAGHPTVSQRSAGPLMQPQFSQPLPPTMPQRGAGPLVQPQFPQPVYPTMPQRSAGPLVQPQFAQPGHPSMPQRGAGPLVQPQLLPPSSPHQQPPPQSQAGGSSGLLSPETSGVMQEIDKIADAARNINAQWGVCKAEVRGLWNSYTNKQLVVGSALWVDGDKFERFPGDKEHESRTVYFAIVTDTSDATPLTRTAYCKNRKVGILSATRQALSGSNDEAGCMAECKKSCVLVKLYNQESDEADDSIAPFLISKPDIYEVEGGVNTFREFLASLWSNQCLNDLWESVKQILASTARMGLVWLREKLSNWWNNGFLAITFEVAQVWPTWLGGTSLKSSEAFSVVIWPREYRGTLASSSCRGKDSNDFSLDIGISLDIGFDKTCYQGAGLNIGAALQFPHGDEIAVGLDIDCEADGSGDLTCRDGLVPKFSGFSIGVGKGFKTQAGFLTLQKAATGLGHDIAWGVMACASTEVYNCGPRPDCPPVSENIQTAVNAFDAAFDSASMLAQVLARP